MTIKIRLYLLGAISLSGIILLVLVATHLIQKDQQLSLARNQITELNVELLMLRRNEKDFLLRLDDKYLDSFNSNVQDFVEIDDSLNQKLESFNFTVTTRLVNDLKAYQEGFTSLVKQQSVLGLDDDSGLKGEFNRLINEALPSLNEQQKEATFYLTNDIQQGKVSTSSTTQNLPLKLTQAAKAVVEQAHIVGVAYNEGLKGQVRTLSHTIEQQFGEYASQIDSQIEDYRASVSTIKWTISIAVVLLVAFVIMHTMRSINRNMYELISTIGKITSTNDVSLRVKTEGKDELSTIGCEFNKLLKKLEDIVSGSQQKSLLLTSNTESMHGQLEGVITQFKKQSEHTTTMATSVSQMVSTINEISESTTVAASGVQHATENARIGRKVVESTISKIEQLSTTLNHSQESIASLNTNVDQIGGAVVIIQEIAEQTNLLALNAAIEAARAGEQGRGFAVVADEVRALASRTHQSTEEIANVVSSIQKQMSTVVNDITDCTTQGSETKNSSQELDESLSKIIGDMGSIQANSESIASAIEEQGIVMNQVSESIMQLNDISTNNMRAAENCLLEVNSVSTQALEMNKAVSVFKTA
ncbi:chemotaxis protein (plasmid) [Vibrio sp. qd031]|uniref:methyl-accepting chemotaxis protein n=1 Tax=Vibrio sp. qd031 TaxID=1603038 RepID=UPI000A10C73C|nr:methyl-accepting chemotaxis protein [Vibrio sp. qd031]ORT52561.1 chemotaxis protein [Vibrio sp. qd031]